MEDLQPQSPMPLFSEPELADFRSQWSKVQTGFVDEPRRTVEDADKLVAAVMQRLAEGFTNERSGLERQWDSGDNVSTEDLRVALQRYRFFWKDCCNCKDEHVTCRRAANKVLAILLFGRRRQPLQTGLDRFLHDKFVGNDDYDTDGMQVHSSLLNVVLHD